MYNYTFDWQDDGGYKEIEAENIKKLSNTQSKTKLSNEEKVSSAKQNN